MPLGRMPTQELQSLAVCRRCNVRRRVAMVTGRGPLCANCTTECARCHGRAGAGDCYTAYSEDGGTVRVCYNCARLLHECYECGVYVLENAVVEVENRRGAFVFVCPNHVGECEGCGADCFGTRCHDCSGLLHSNDYRPPLVLHSATGETEARYFLGFEVEVEAGEENSAIPPKQIPPWVWCKEDGSLDNGFEVVSHPLSPRWLREHRGEVEGLLAKLRDIGLESYDTSTCGMHVHVSRTAFDGTFHLLKFLEMFYHWGGWTLIVSQRQEELLDRWATCGAAKEDVYRKAKIKANSHDDRYTAVNLENDATFEVRVFRGTLETLGFFKNLQYVEAVIEFTRDESRRKVTPRQFREWVSRQEKRYPDLVEWLRRTGHLGRGRD